MKFNWFVLLTLASLFLCSCSTYQTVTGSRPNSPKVFSGTRLNLLSIQNDTRGLRVYRESFGIEGQGHPWLDLPISLLMDFMLLPLTLSAAANDMVFNR